MTDGDRCPEGGIIGEDWKAYTTTCLNCPLRNECQKKHEEKSFHRRELLKMPYLFLLPYGLFEDKNINNQQRIIIALVYFRSKRFGHSYDKNKSIAELLDISECYVSKLIHQLVRSGYLVEEIQRLKRKRRDAGPAYRTSRKLGLGIKAVRLLNRWETDEKRFATVMNN
ncbi:hypothetical protein [Marispirochaeta aestuarii]|uniref:hypothetical protein n=1 Tax=Marispirochaeta aestuarii TaxID=1963862 RepID=UPI0029C7D99D|nr:hypothetical protein [Marispirochaeta aestuarii]